MNSPSWVRPNHWQALAISLCFLTLFISIFLHITHHQPPIGVYIAIMGVAAAAVTFRKEPSLREKAAWIVLLTLLMFAEVRNLYIADIEQAEKFKNISDGLDATSKRLQSVAEESQRQFAENLRQLGQIKTNQDQTYKETETNIRKSSSLLLQHVQSDLVPTKLLNLVIVLGAPKLTSDQFRRVLNEAPMTLEGYHLADESLRKIICAERNRIPFVEFRLVLNGLPGIEYVLGRKISNENKKEVCELDSSLVYEAGGKTHRETISTNIYLVNESLGATGPVELARSNRRMIVLATRLLPNEKLLGQPLYASSLGEVQSAKLSLSGEDENLIISDAVDTLEPLVPSSIAVNVQGWYSVPAAYKAPFKPSFEKIWHMERTDRYDLDGGRGAEYDFVP